MDLPSVKNANLARDGKVLANENMPFVRTLGMDINRLAKENKIEEKDYSKIDKKLISKAQEYEAAGGDQGFVEKLRVYKKQQDLEALGLDNVDSRLQGMPIIGEKFIPRNEVPISIVPRDPADNSELIKKVDVKKFVSKPVLESHPLEHHELLLAHNPESKPAILEDDDIAKIKDLIKKEKVLEDALQKSLNKIEEVQNLYSDYNKEKEDIKTLLIPLADQEKEIENKETIIEEQELRPHNPEQERKLNEARWIFEDTRKHIEEERWKLDERMLGIEEKISETLQKKGAFEQEKKNLEQEISEVKKQKNVIEAKKQKKIFSERLGELGNIKKQIADELKNLMGRKEETESALNLARQKNKDWQNQMIEMEVKEKSIISVEEKHQFEAKRWEIEGLRRRNEKDRWRLQDEFALIENSLMEWNRRSVAASEAEKFLQNKIKELESGSTSVSTSENSL
jgi:hypothetical protein